LDEEISEFDDSQLLTFDTTATRFLGKRYEDFHKVMATTNANVKLKDAKDWPKWIDEHYVALTLPLATAKKTQANSYIDNRLLDQDPDTACLMVVGHGNLTCTVR